MGGGGKKKQFVDHRKSATFRLVPSTGGVDDDRVFFRVDSNTDYSVPGFGDDDESAQLDLAQQLDDVVSAGGGRPLPDDVRRDILELGLPDDGYNYLAHLREIRSSGAGAAFVPNPRAQLNRLPLDVKAYDASKVRIKEENGDGVEMLEGSSLIYQVAAKARVVRKVEKVVDPDVSRLLDESDLSRCGSDVEDLDEDFVIMANRPEGEDEVVEVEEKAERKVQGVNEDDDRFADADEEEEEDAARGRVQRLLDEQFDMLALEEYGDSEDDDDDDFGRDAELELPPEVMAELKLFHGEKLGGEEGYRAPADIVHGKQELSMTEDLEVSADVIRKCVEYAERYLNEDKEDKDVVLLPESSDESEVWDCETIVSTYSNLDNHPGKIKAPENGKKWLPKVFPGETASKNNVIKLEGKEMLPVQYLPQKKRNDDKEKKPKAVAVTSDKDLSRRGDESKEEKKERKAAVKEQRREARKAKKELKGLYKCETQKAQKVAAISEPSSIRLM